MCFKGHDPRQKISSEFSNIGTGIQSNTSPSEYLVLKARRYRHTFSLDFPILEADLINVIFFILRRLQITKFTTPDFICLWNAAIHLTFLFFNIVTC